MVESWRDMPLSSGRGRKPIRLCDSNEVADVITGPEQSTSLKLGVVDGGAGGVAEVGAFRLGDLVGLDSCMGFCSGEADEEFARFSRSSNRFLSFLPWICQLYIPWVIGHNVLTVVALGNSVLYPSPLREI